MLVGINILSSKQAIVNIGRERLTLPLCRDLQAKLSVTSKQARTIGKVVLASKKVTVPANLIMPMPVRLRKATQLPPNQDFMFQPAAQGLNLGLQDGSRAYIVNTNFSFIEVQNATDQPVVISRKVRLGKVLDYKAERCYAVNANKTYLSAGSSWPKPRITAVLDNPQKTEEHATGLSAYGLKLVCDKLFATAMAHWIWSKAGGFINVPEEEWMPILLQLNATPTGGKVYQLKPNDRKLIEKTFDLLHEQGKIK